MQEVLLILTNVPDAQSARAISRLLVERRLAACVNILPAVQSVYRWRGAVEEANEITLLIKSSQARYSEVEAAIKTEHPYQVPEIIAMPVVAGLPAYLDWVVMEIQKDLNV